MSVKLESEIGTELYLEIAGTTGRQRCKLVGVIPKQLLIIHVSDKLTSLLEAQQKLPTVTIRAISRGIAFGFQTDCLRLLANPAPLLFLNYPKIIQKQSIRKNRRVKCLLPAKFAQDTTGIPGVIVDISNSGCHFQSTNDLNEHQKALVQVEQQVLLSFELPGKETPKTLEAMVRNTYLEPETIHVGFEFIDPDAAIINVLDEFIALSFDIQPF